MQINHSSIWRELEAHQVSNKNNNRTLLKLFESDRKRLQHMSLQVDNIWFDYSKQLVCMETISKLIAMAKFCQLSKHIASLFSGELVNTTENRAALHHKLREPQPTLSIQNVLVQMGELSDKINNNFTDVICLGIGGSELGPRLVCEALASYKRANLNLHFIANADKTTLNSLLIKLNAKKTACLISSKSFTTLETLTNARMVKKWLADAVGEEAAKRHLVAITANKPGAFEFGLLAEQILEFWEWVGGRYSVWSAVGFPIVLLLGLNQFKEFLNGAYKMDLHFKTAEFTRNMPVLMGLIGIWNINFLKYNTLAIMPYLDALATLPSYLQQLEMESNGKLLTNTNVTADYHTAPIIWGGVGCNGQHSYMQLLHQGSEVTPVDFILDISADKLLTANCLAQGKALMLGTDKDFLYDKQFKHCSGNRPSNTVVLEKLTPFTLGSLIALYEHKVYVQGIIWQIQSFDQWGVELGKKIANETILELEPISNTIAGLVNYLSTS